MFFVVYFLFVGIMPCRVSDIVTCTNMSVRLELYEAGYFGDPSIKFQIGIKTAYKHFKDFIKEKKIQCSQPCFTEKKVWQDGEPCWNLKAYNGRVVASWLSSCAVDLAKKFVDNDDFKLMAFCMYSAQFV